MFTDYGTNVGMRRKSLGQSPFKPQKFGDSPGFAYSSAFH